jgi:hypothetical protein
MPMGANAEMREAQPASQFLTAAVATFATDRRICPSAPTRQLRMQQSSMNGMPFDERGGDFEAMQVRGQAVTANLLVVEHSLEHANRALNLTLFSISALIRPGLSCRLRSSGWGEKDVEDAAVYRRTDYLRAAPGGTPSPTCVGSSASERLTLQFSTPSTPHSAVSGRRGLGIQGCSPDASARSFSQSRLLTSLAPQYPPRRGSPVGHRAAIHQRVLTRNTGAGRRYRGVARRARR